MQLSQNYDAARPARTNENQVTDSPKDAPTVVQTAAKWVGRAVDPRGTVKLLSRAGTALGALALQTRGAGATSAPCYDYRNFKSPNSGSAYAIDTGCSVAKKFVDRFVSACGAVPTGRDYPLFWHHVKSWAGTTIYRHSNEVANDAGFEACLIKEGGVLSKHENVIAGIVVGSVLGALVVVGGIALGIKYCCCTRGGSARDVEGSGEAAAAAVAPTLPMALPPVVEMQPTEPSAYAAHGPPAGYPPVV